MKTKEFKKWLEDNGYGTNTISSRLSNVRTIEDAYGDLDQQMMKDSCQSIIDELSYSREDEYMNRQPRHKIQINGNIRNGSATYKQALKRYQQFYQETSSSKIVFNSDFEKLAHEIYDKINSFEHKLLNKKHLEIYETPLLQEDLFKSLKQQFPDIKWEIEKVYDEINKINDRIDILGTVDESHCIVIELDPPRADSISKKFVSRLALYSDVNLIYITACYPNEIVEKTKEYKKYFKYCETIMRCLDDTNLEKYYKGILLWK